jgi:hypothetical protein
MKKSEIPTRRTIKFVVGIMGLCWCSVMVHGQTNTPTPTPSIVYIADFQINAANLKTDPATPPAPPKAPGLLGKVLPPPPGAKKDPQDLACELVESMSAAIIKDLTKAELTARRLPTGDPLPTAGWLVRGVFTNVNQGNQLERAVIGFGKGKTDLQVLVDIADLAKAEPAHFHEVKAPVGVGTKAPGAASMIGRHPAAVAVKFVLAGKDLDKNVKQTAAQIADEVVARTNPNKAIRSAEAKKR